MRGDCVGWLRTWQLARGSTDAGRKHAGWAAWVVWAKAGVMVHGGVRSL